MTILFIKENIFVFIRFKIITVDYKYKIIFASKT